MKILTIFIYIILFYILFLKLIQKTAKKNYTSYYTKKDKILTETELKYYNVLKEIATELNLKVIMQVSLYEIIKANNNYGFNKISRKTIDFVLIDEETNIKLCIELDDYTHKYKKRIERDNFINELFKQVDIPLLRQPVYQQYYKTTLLNNIKNLIEKKECTEPQKLDSIN